MEKKNREEIKNISCDLISNMTPQGCHVELTLWIYDSNR